MGVSGKAGKIMLPDGSAIHLIPSILARSNQDGTHPLRLVNRYIQLLDRDLLIGHEKTDWKLLEKKMAQFISRGTVKKVVHVAPFYLPNGDLRFLILDGHHKFEVLTSEQFKVRYLPVLAYRLSDLIISTWEPALRADIAQVEAWTGFRAEPCSMIEGQIKLQNREAFFVAKQQLNGSKIACFAFSSGRYSSDIKGLIALSEDQTRFQMALEDQAAVKYVAKGFDQPSISNGLIFFERLPFEKQQIIGMVRLGLQLSPKSTRFINLFNHFVDGRDKTIPIEILQMPPLEAKSALQRLYSQETTHEKSLVMA